MLTRQSFLALFIISSINFISVQSVFHNISTTAFPSDPLFLQFSKNQKYLACGSEKQIDVYDGLTLNHLKTFPLEQGDKLKGLDFSRDENRIAFGFQAGDGSYRYKETDIMGNKTIRLNKKVENDKQQNISGICYSANSSNYVIGFLENFIHLQQQGQVSKYGIDESVVKIACSPTTPELFGIITTNKVVVFQILIQISNISKVYEQYFNTTEPSDISFSNDILCVSVSDTVHVYDTTDYRKLTQYTFGNKKINKVVAAKNVFGMSESNYVYLQNTKDHNFEIVIKLGNNFALANNGYNILVMTSQKQADLLTKCTQKDYFDFSSQTCISCSDKYKCLSCRQKEKCQVCEDNYTANSLGVCSCPSGKYDFNKTCQLCPYRCQNCTSQNICQSCSETFRLSGQSCVCPRTTYQQNKKCVACQQNCLDCSNSSSCLLCKEGFELIKNSCKEPEKTNVLLIVLLIVGVVILIGAIVGFVIFWRRRKAKKGLLEDEEDEVDERVKI